MNVKISDDFIKNYGPLIFWFFMFAIIAMLKAFAFEEYDHTARQNENAKLSMYL